MYYSVIHIEYNQSRSVEQQRSFRLVKTRCTHALYLRSRDVCHRWFLQLWPPASDYVKRFYTMKTIHSKRPQTELFIQTHEHAATNLMLTENLLKLLHVQTP